MRLHKFSKSQKLFLGIVCDLLGYVSFVFPFFDIVWAPLSGFIMSKLYEGNKGKIAAILVFIEEALPFLDVLPSFSIMWAYDYYFDKSSK